MKYTNIKQAIMLSEKQDAYLREQIQGFSRHKALDTFRNMAAMEDSHYSKKGFSANLTIGQFVISTSELSKLWKCDRKTAISIIEEFNELGFLVSTTNNRTTLHSIQCICCWYVDELTEPIRNPFYERSPICLTKEQRAALSKEVMTGKYRQGKPTLTKDFLDLFVSLDADKVHDDHVAAVETDYNGKHDVAVHPSPSSILSKETNPKAETGGEGQAENPSNDAGVQQPSQNHAHDHVAAVSTPQQDMVKNDIPEEDNSDEGVTPDSEAEDPDKGTCASPSDSDIF